MTIASQLDQEIHQQPAALQRLLEQGAPAVKTAAARIRSFDPQWVVVAARGTSDNAARYAKYLFGAHNRLGVGLAAASLCTLYDAPPNLERALTIGISQSGQSPDVVAVLAAARRQGGVTLAITNDISSPLAAAADVAIPLAAGEERAVAATKTYTNQLLVVAMLSAALEDDPARWTALEGLPQAVQSVLETVELAAPAKGFAAEQQFLVIGRGFNYCTAFEIALKMKETSYVLAEPYSVADLLHGPVAMLDEGFPVLAVGPEGKGADDVAEVIDLLLKRRVRLIALSDRQDILSRAEVAVPLPAGVPEWLSPIVAVVPGQLWARCLAVAKGLDPDCPRGLSKVTLTR